MALEMVVIVNPKSKRKVEEEEKKTQMSNLVILTFESSGYAFFLENYRILARS